MSDESLFIFIQLILLLLDSGRSTGPGCSGGLVGSDSETFKGVAQCSTLELCVSRAAAAPESGPVGFVVPIPLSESSAGLSADPN